MRALVPKVCVEDAPIAADRIHLIALTNVTHLTGARIGDVNVTDEFAFRRYFGDTGVEVVEVGGEPLSELVGLRNTPIPTASDFLRYLNELPQVAFVTRHLKQGVHFYPKVRDTSPAVVAMTYDFEGLNDAFAADRSGSPVPEAEAPAGEA